jgi:YbbR domain-containing protein
MDSAEFTQKGSYDIDNVSLVAYDINGNVVKNVEIVSTNITAKVELDSYSKKVPVNVLTTGELLSGKAISSIKINDKDISDFSVTIFGEESIIDTIESVPVTIDVSGQGNNNSKSYNVTISKPSGVRLISEPNANIVLNFGEAKQKTIRVNKIKTRNVPNGLVANLASVEDQSIDVQVIGVEEVISEIDENSSTIEAYVDLTGLTAGTYSVAVKVEGTDSRLQYIVTKNVSVVLSPQSTN